jgi:hypothetical protein
VRQVVADTAPWAYDSGYAHDSQTCIQSRGLLAAAAGTAAAVLAGVRAVTDEIETGYDAGPAGVAFVAQGALGR